MQANLHPTLFHIPSFPGNAFRLSWPLITVFPSHITRLRLYLIVHLFSCLCVSVTSVDPICSSILPNAFHITPNAFHITLNGFHIPPNEFEGYVFVYLFICFPARVRL